MENNIPTIPPIFGLAGEPTNIKKSTSFLDFSELLDDFLINPLDEDYFEEMDDEYYAGPFMNTLLPSNNPTEDHQLFNWDPSMMNSLLAPIGGNLSEITEGFDQFPPFSNVPSMLGNVQAVEFAQGQEQADSKPSSGAGNNKVSQIPASKTFVEAHNNVFLQQQFTSQPWDELSSFLPVKTEMGQNSCEHSAPLSKMSGISSDSQTSPSKMKKTENIKKRPSSISARIGFSNDGSLPPQKRSQKENAEYSDDDSDEDSSKKCTDPTKLERRERNREHAKRSRLRKKFLLDALQYSVISLEQENQNLKNNIIQELGEEGKMLVENLPPAVTTRQTLTKSLGNPLQQGVTILDDPDYSLVKALQSAQQNFVITDPLLPDNPIVFASAGFLSLTGYALDQVLGRNCRFLQGPETDPRAILKIREAIQNGSDCSVCLLNYTKEGTTFWNQFFIAALRDGNGQIVNYVGVQCKVSEKYAKEHLQSQFPSDS